MAYGSWHTSAGIATEYDITITNAYFGTVERAGDGLYLFWEGVDEEGNEVKPAYSCGKGWQTHDNGKTAMYYKKNGQPNPAQEFQGAAAGRFASNYGLLIDRVVGQFNMEAVLKQRGFDDPRKSAGWIGLRFHMQSEEYQFGEETRTRTLPVAFLGVTQTTTTTRPASSTSVPAGNPKGPAPSTGPLPGQAGYQVKIPDEVMAELKQLAATATSKTDFENKAWAVQGVRGSSSVAAAVIAPGFYESLTSELATKT